MQLISIGTSSANKIVINDPHVSSYHAEILLGDDGSIFITDKGSTNGTKVRGQKIQTETEVAVNRGDKITFAGVVDLNWSNVPAVSPPPPGWKLFGIGSGLRNRIQVSDPAGRVSRYHATLKIDPKGKIFMNDHSSNGTFVNGLRLQSGQDVRIRRKDKIMFANVTPLNWALIPASRPPLWKYAAAAVAVLLLVAGIYGYAKSGDPDSTAGGVFAKITGIFGGKQENWSEKIYKTYSNSIVCVYHEYRMVANLLDGKTKLILSLNKNGDLVLLDDEKVWPYPFVIEGSEEAARYSDLLNRGINGTAFFVDKNGTLVTNRHITMPWETLEKSDKMIVLERQLNDPRWFKQKIKDIKGETVYIGIAYNKSFISGPADFEDCSILSRTTDNTEKDIGLLSVKNQKQLPQNFTPISLDKAIIDRGKITIGQDVCLIGYPLGEIMFSLRATGTTNTKEVILTTQTGAISQATDNFKFGHNAPSYGGASGSPMFNKKGQLIGVHNSGLAGAGISGFSWGILAKHAKELYDKE